MTIYYAFSDESGHYKRNRTQKDNERYPYYVRAIVLFEANQWKYLNSQFLSLKNEFGLSRQQEVKWDYIWEIKQCQEHGKKPNKEIQSLVESYHWDCLLTFCEKFLLLMDDLPVLKIILTITDNRRCHNIRENYLLQFHLKNTMQRIQMEIQKNNDNLAVLFFDSIDEKKDKMLSEVYSSIYESGDFIANYSSIQDCLHFEKSRQSVGIQLVDIIASISMNRLRNREESTRLFDQYIYPHLRRSAQNEIMGYGVIEIPSDKELRHEIELLINSYLSG
jgi:hypothetical protein